MPSPLSFRLEAAQVLNTLFGIFLKYIIGQLLLDGAFNNSVFHLSLPSLLYTFIFFCQSMTFIILYSYYTLGIT